MTTHPDPAREEEDVIVNGVNMGSPEEAANKLAEAAAKWRECRQPRVATPKEHRAWEGREREALFQIGNAAMLWLWHREAHHD